MSVNKAIKENENIPDSLHLIQNAFSTILLDAIQFFPQGTKKFQAESRGLLFGLEREDFMECDYVFPVGNVNSRTNDGVEHNPKVDQAVHNAKHILSMSKHIGSYHSHPNLSYFKELAEPSNADVDYVAYSKNLYELIIAICPNGKTEKPLALEFKTELAKEFYFDKKAGDHDSPKCMSTKFNFQYICGEFKKYRFEIRAYKFNGKGLQDINLYSSEAGVLIKLIQEKINISNLDTQGVNSVRKLEYDYRLLNKSSDKRHNRIAQNIDYHIHQLKKITASDKNQDG